MHDPQSQPPGPPDVPNVTQPPTPPVQTESPTEPFVSTWAAPASAETAPAAAAQPPATATPAAWAPPRFAPPEPPGVTGPAGSAYAATGTTRAFAPPEPPAAAPRATTGRRSGGSGMVIGAVLATAVLASGGTYIAMNAAGANREIATEAPVFAPAAAGPGIQPTQAPVAAAPATPGPVATAAPAAPVAPGSGQASVVDIVKAVSPAVVTIVADGVTETDPTSGMSGTGTATGSGVIFDANGLVLTNRHVVEGSPSKLTVHLKDGRSFDATVYGVDTLTDLAIVKVEATGLPTAPIGDSSSIQVGQQAIAIGSPLGEFTDSVTSGIISGMGRSIDTATGSLSNLIQTDTAINPGNSGGPLLDSTGSVIAINTAIASSSQGIGFAIPINIARPLLAQASAGQALARPWLGLMFRTITPAIQQEASLPVADGAWIPSASALSGQAGGGQGSNGQGINPNDPFNQDPNALGGGSAAIGQVIVPGSPAEQAGLQAGDIITALNGTALDGAHPLDLVLSQSEPGQAVTLDVVRDGQTIEVSLTLGTRPATQ